MKPAKTDKSDRLRQLREAKYKGQPTPRSPRLLKQALAAKPSKKSGSARGR